MKEKLTYFMDRSMTLRVDRRFVPPMREVMAACGLIVTALMAVSL